MIKDDRTVIVKMIPQIYAIWKKVHPAIPLRSERSVKEQLVPMFDRYSDCKNKKVKASLVNNTRESANSVFNCTNCKLRVRPF